MTESHDHLLVEQLREIIRHELGDRASLKKNGHTWGQYLGKLVTPERVMLAILAVFSFGGRVQEMQAGVAEAVKVAAQAKEVQTRLLKEISSLRDTVDEQKSVIADQQMSHATKSDVVAVSDRIRLNVTRREFEEAIYRGLVPRLDRIEQSVKALP